MGGYWHRLSPVSVGTGSVSVRFKYRSVPPLYSVEVFPSGTTLLLCPKCKGRGGAEYRRNYASLLPEAQGQRRGGVPGIITTERGYPVAKLHPASQVKVVTMA